MKERALAGGVFVAVAVLVALAAIAALGMVLAARVGDRDPAAADRPESPATPEATPSANPSPAPAGFLPVDSLGQSEVPWAEVGQGWFLVQWKGSEPPIVEERHVGPFPSGLSLIGSGGDVYALTELGVVDAAWVIGWRGDEVGVARQPDVAEGDSGDTATVNLRTGAETVVSTGGWVPDGDAWAANGDLLGSRYLGDLPVDIFAYRDYRPVGKVCEGNGTTGFMSPDGIRLVCLSFLPTDAQKTAVVIARADQAESAEQIDVFQAPPYRYSIAGWHDADTFLLVRWPEGGEGASDYFAYNIATHTISGYSLPDALVPESRNTRLEFDNVSQTYLLVTRGQVDFYGPTGTPIATVPCGDTDDSPYGPGVAYSGAFALVTCVGSPFWESDASAALVDLVHGTTTTIATFRGSVDAHLGGITGYPEHG